MLSNISQLQLYSYSFKENAFSEQEAKERPHPTYDKEVGVLAQEVETLIPDAVRKMVYTVCTCTCTHNITNAWIGIL